MKQRELKKCAVCDRGMMHGGGLTFFQLRVRHMVVNLPAVQGQHGLELMLGQCAFVAQHIGPDEDMAVPLTEFEVLICSECSSTTSVAQLLEKEGKVA